MKVECGKDMFIIGNVYRPPNSPSSFLDESLDLVEQALESCHNVVITGDLNYNVLSEKGSQQIKSIETMFRMKQIISSPTRVTKDSSSLLDVIITNVPEKMRHTVVCDLAE